MKLLFSADELSRKILSFIGTEDYNRILNNIQDTKESGFITGMAVAGMIATTINYECIGIEEDSITTVDLRKNGG